MNFTEQINALKDTEFPNDILGEVIVQEVINRLNIEHERIQASLNDFELMSYLIYRDYRKEQRMSCNVPNNIVQLVQSRYFLTEDITSAQAGYILACSECIRENSEVQNVVNKSMLFGQLGIYPGMEIFQFLCDVMGVKKFDGLDVLESHYGDLQTLLRTTSIEEIFEHYLYDVVYLQLDNILLPDETFLYHYLQNNVNYWTVSATDYIMHELELKKISDVYDVLFGLLYDYPFSNAHNLTGEQKYYAECFVTGVHKQLEKKNTFSHTFCSKVYSSLIVIYERLGLDFEQLFKLYDNNLRLLLFGSYWYFNFMEGI